MTNDREQFGLMLDRATAEVRKEASDQQKFEARFKAKSLRNFAPLWRTLKVVDRELRKRNIGSVEKDTEVPYEEKFTAKFSAIYRFKKSGEDFPIIFEFDTPEMLSIYLMSRSARPFKFSIDEIESAKEALMTWASIYFRSAEAA